MTLRYLGREPELAVEVVSRFSRQGWEMIRGEIPIWWDNRSGATDDE